MQSISLLVFTFILLTVSTFGFKNVRHSASNKLIRPRNMELQMGGKMSKFGIFSPIVYVAKFALGEAKFNKVRGKAISLHSQAITEWCLLYGAYNIRLKLVITYIMIRKILLHYFNLRNILM